MAFRRVAEADGPTDGDGPATPEPTTPPDEEAHHIGPPLYLLALGGLSVALSFALVPIDGVATNVMGYLCGTLIPIVAIGLFRRFDLFRRRSPSYRSGSFRSWMVPTVAILGFLAGALHTWALATRLAS